MWFYVNTLFDTQRFKVFYMMCYYWLSKGYSAYRKRYFTFSAIELYLPFEQCFRGLWSINWMVGAIEEIHFRWDCLIKLVLIFYLLLDGTIAWEKFWNMNSVSVSYLFTVLFSKPLYRRINYVLELTLLLL